MLKYCSGEEILKGDRVRFHGNAAVVYLVACDPESTISEVRWYMDEYGGGVMIIERSMSCCTFIAAEEIDDYDDLEFVARDE
jgi:hypothetical protein